MIIERMNRLMFLPSDYMYMTLMNKTTVSNNIHKKVNPKDNTKKVLRIFLLKRFEFLKLLTILY